MARRFYDEEFSPAVLHTLKKREVLGQANPAQFVPLVYNVYIEAEAMEQRFDAERRENPLLETTPPEAWLAAEVMPAIGAIRPNVEIKESILVAALQRYFRCAVPPTANETASERLLWTTIRPYRAAVKKLLLDLYDRQKSLRGILRIPVAARTAREALTARKPSSLKEETILQGIKEQWKNQRIARVLDERDLVPRDYKSYTEMLRTSPQHFYSWKSGIKTKYRAVSNLKEEI